MFQAIKNLFKPDTTYQDMFKLAEKVSAMSRQKQFYVVYSGDSGRVGATDVLIKDFTTFDVNCVNRIYKALNETFPKQGKLIITNIIPLDPKETTK